MKNLHTRSCALFCSGAVLALACGVSVAADPGGGLLSHRTVYQQRLPDGTLLLTDRIPYGGEDNLLEQSWTFAAEDPAQAEARRAQLRELREAHDAVNERLNRMIAQRDRLAAEQQMERTRLASLRAWADAERDRLQQQAAPVSYVVPVRSHPHAPRPWPGRPQRP